MKALYYLGDKTMELRQVPIPEPAADEYLIRMETCGICGSDLEGYLGKTNRRHAPMVMGHEGAGVVERAPEGALYPVGTRVAIFPNYFCGTCALCRAGKTNDCQNGIFLGILGFDGCMTEYITMREEFMIPFGEELSFEEAAMVEPLAVAYDAVAKASPEQIEQAEHILVIGGGTIGLMILALLKNKNAKNVVVSDTFDHRLALAEKMGAGAVINPVKEDFGQAVARTTGGKGFALVIEAVGFSSTAASSVEALSPCGTAIWVGNAQKMVEVNMQKIVTTENNILGSHIYTLEEFKASLQLLADKQVNVLPLITDHFALEEGVAAFKSLEDNADGKRLKVILHM